ncbi:hypothetical protein Clacol_006678 [Clathrus columnatus]|uniref:Peroxisomal-coenzyme A synthetase n=1 Tax=Clathrus columnatus TaxID=1419009 RepID=A0AAV5ACR2_9AGAM|nr:hypothetical protein Clacol_006678 [Clathrus columnatus]
MPNVDNFPNTTLATLLDPPFTANESGHTENIALILPKPLEITLSYPNLKKIVYDFRTQLVRDLGVRTGNVVSMAFPNSLEFVVAFLGIGTARAIAAPFNPGYTTSEFEFYLEDTKPVFLILPDLEALSKNKLGKIITGDKGIHAGVQAACEAAKKFNLPIVWMHIDSRTGHPYLRPESTIEMKRPSSSVQASIDNGLPLPSDTALVLHTSGTTSRPKSVPLTHHNLLTTTHNIVQTYSLTPSDVSYLVMPLFHVHGLLAGLLAPLRTGASVVLPFQRQFSASRFWDDMSTWSCTYYTAVPTIHAIVLGLDMPTGGIPKSLRFVRSCSSSLPPVILERLEKKLSVPICEAYAMTEAAHQMTSTLPTPGYPRVPGSVGSGVGVQVSIRSEENGQDLGRGKIGEVCVRGENVTKGYWNNEEANKKSFWEGRWFRTGDQGILNLSDGTLRLTGRLKELINRGGEKISPIEVDSALVRVPGVKEAVSFGVEDPSGKYGEVVWAGIVLDGSIKPSPDEESRIKKDVAKFLAKFKVPERVIITPAIPKTATGKVQRRQVRDAFVKQVKESGTKVKAKL